MFCEMPVKSPTVVGHWNPINERISRIHLKKLHKARIILKLVDEKITEVNAKYFCFSTFHIINVKSFNKYTDLILGRISCFRIVSIN